MVFHSNLLPSFLSVYIHGSVGDVRAASIPNLNIALLVQLTFMLHESSHYVQFFSALRNLATPVIVLHAFRLIIHTGECHATDHVRRHNGSWTTEVAAVIPGVVDSIVGRQDSVIRRREELIANGFKRFDTIPVTHRPYSPPSYVLLLIHRTNESYPGHQLQSFSSPRRQSPRMTSLVFYAYQRFQRPIHFNTILRGGRLL